MTEYTIVELVEPTEPDYVLCGHGLWCDLVCRYPWTCKYMKAWWKKEHSDWSFEQFKEHLKKKMPLGLGKQK